MVGARLDVRLLAKQKAAGSSPVYHTMTIDGYDLTGWFVKDATPEQGAAALRAAGITPEEFNAPDDAKHRPMFGAPPRSRYLFGWEFNRLVAWRG